MTKIKVVKQAPPKPKATVSVHKSINWIVSIVLVVFAIWSISLNAEGRGLYKQSITTLIEIDKKLETAAVDLKATKEACQQQTTIVVPTTTTDNQTTQ